MRKCPWATAMTVLAAAVLVGCSSGNTDNVAAPQPVDAPLSSESPADVAERGADSSESVESSEPVSSQENADTPNEMDWTVDLPARRLRRRLSENFVNPDRRARSSIAR